MGGERERKTGIESLPHGKNKLEKNETKTPKAKQHSLTKMEWTTITGRTNESVAVPAMDQGAGAGGRGSGARALH